MADPRLRFHVELDGGAVALRLAAPHDRSAITLSALETELWPVPGPVDLRHGAEAFRHRRGRARAARAEVGIATLAGHLFEPHVLVTIDEVFPDGLEVTVRGGGVVVGFTLRFSVDGRDLLLWPAEVRGRPRDGLPPHEHLFAMVRPSEAVQLEPPRLRVKDPLAWALREALLPGGYRVPSLGPGPIEARLSGTRLVLEIGATSPLAESGAQPAGRAG